MVQVQISTSYTKVCKANILLHYNDIIAWMTPLCHVRTQQCLFTTKLETRCYYLMKTTQNRQNLTVSIHFLQKGDLIKQIIVIRANSKKKISPGIIHALLRVHFVFITYNNTFTYNNNRNE